MNDLSRLKVLHVTPHLGGGVGRCLSAISSEKSDRIDREFLLLEPPIDKFFYNQISQEYKISNVNYNHDLEKYLMSFDIIQCEFWNHPAMLHFLSFSKNYKLRRIFWCHISGLGAIRFPTGFLNSHNKIIFTSNISNMKYGTEKSVVNSGFVFSDSKFCDINAKRNNDFVFAGQLDYAKLHSEFANIMTSAAQLSGSELNILGTGKDELIVQSKIQPKNVVFRGKVTNVQEYFRQAKFLIYPLNEKHYGTGENIIKEAMSVGCIPLLLANPAELEIMGKYSDFLCHRTVDGLIQSFGVLIDDDEIAKNYSHRLREFSQQKYSPKFSVNLLMQIYQDTLNTVDPEAFEMESSFGSSPTEWCAAFGNYTAHNLNDDKHLVNKGSRIHFERYFSQDERVLGVNYAG